MSKRRGRKDHYLPQGYLRGFIHPARTGFARPLWCFDVPHGKWKERSTSEVGFQVGFYDPKGPGTELEFADSLFAEFERNFPRIRRDLVTRRFQTWQSDRAFLLRYINMIRARSLLFFAEKKAEKLSQPAWRVTEVDHATNRISVVSTLLDSTFIRNRTLIEMREEIERGASQLREFDWTLRYCDTPDDSVTTSESPLVMEGPSGNRVSDWSHPDTLLIFPLCWQAALFGSRRTFDVDLAKFLPGDLKKMRLDRTANSKHYVIASFPG